MSLSGCGPASCVDHAVVIAVLAGLSRLRNPKEKVSQVILAGIILIGRSGV